MITDKNRREVAENLRYLGYGSRVRYKEEFFELLDETVIEPDTGYHEMNDVFDRLADLIDRPTCTIVCECDAYSSWGERIDGMRLYELSCGHQAVGFEKPEHCPKCGAAIVDD